MIKATSKIKQMINLPSPNKEVFHYLSHLIRLDGWYAPHDTFWTARRSIPYQGAVKSRLVRPQNTTLLLSPYPPPTGHLLPPPRRWDADLQPVPLLLLCRHPLPLPTPDPNPLPPLPLLRLRRHRRWIVLNGASPWPGKLHSDKQKTRPPACSLQHKNITIL